MENAKKYLKNDFFDYGQVYSSKPKINHQDILEGIDQHLWVLQPSYNFLKAFFFAILNA